MERIERKTTRKTDKIDLFKMVVAFITAIALCLCCMMLRPDEVSAKAKANKLSATSVTIAMGGTKVVSLNSGSGRWDIANDSIADINSTEGKTIVITPKRAGSTTVTCSVKGKKLSCRVKILNNSIGFAGEETPYCIFTKKAIVLSPGGIPKNREIKDVEFDNKYLNITMGDYGIYLIGYREGLTSVNFILDDGSTVTNKIRIIPRFREGKTKKTVSNYAKWRKNWINRVANSDMTTWEVINAVGFLISNGSYSSKGGNTGIQLWYAGKGTSAAGATMMNDFLHDLGINSKLHFVDKDEKIADIYGNEITYSVGHENICIKLDGKTYTLNPQPGLTWPKGIICDN